MKCSLAERRNKLIKGKKQIKKQKKPKSKIRRKGPIECFLLFVRCWEEDGT